MTKIVIEHLRCPNAGCVDLGSRTVLIYDVARGYPLTCPKCGMAIFEEYVLKNAVI